ncbi:soluble lytic murein transglycosylase [Secundilactobacillus oryzae JCM 18671]|uniref:Soluble lytic murein transglycosylase n=1 Tax=Secundilactobacillus oryzae JCM 18671 TaxID=1291743 RepID=A0A081BI46_9LACO|nr:LysM peptidoglycan-binding domain-containing protein [Secundilactobacillus oryzae]GAK47714.1 soluble lytic murein transglycosylase [Secundilactobacillus oryzae JCM 18671]
MAKQAKASKKANPTTYVVVEGDSEYLVSKKLGVSVGSLRDANTRFPAPYLKVGRKINVPQ